MSLKYENVYKLEEFNTSKGNPIEAHHDFKAVSVEDMIASLKFQIIHIDEDNYEMEFDLIGTDPPIANAIRRILMAEIPTMAIDKVYMYNNTTVIPDEVLSHRLGLIPIKVDPRAFEYKSEDASDDGTEEDTIQFELKVKCTRKSNISKNVPMPDEKTCDHYKVYSGDLKFVPIGNQKEMYGDIRPVNEDILLAVMRAGHEIDLKAFCYKNIGREHAKFSPVVVATYRLLPQLNFLSEITDDKADKLKNCFPEGVIKVSEKKGKRVAKVSNPRKIMCSRNVFMHEDLKNEVEILKVKNHFIFTVESTGSLPPEILVPEAINILKKKCRYFLKEMKSLKL